MIDWALTLALAAITGASASILGWGVWITRKVYSIDKLGLTRKEHQDSCDRKHTQLNERFDEMRELIQRNEAETKKYRDAMLDSIQTMKIDVAVLKEKRS